MPLPWKKTKVTRISQIVADLQSPKHGRPLVVETGFPTSLIDLFVKNRNCLKTPSIKKKKKNIQNKDVDSRNSNEITAHSCSNSSICVEPSCGEVENLSFQSEFFGGSSVFLVLLTIFAVVVLALSTKKLVVGITLSAFVLLCLEYLDKHFLCFFKPFVLEELVDGFESNSIVEEIEILEPNIDIDEEDYSCKKTNVTEEGEILVEKNKSNKKGKTREKLIMNFVPKRLQSSKKRKKYKGNKSSSDVSSYFEDDTSGKLEEQ
ncbi:hypothetical protein UlMin_034296 [Ulmus minor]